MKGLQSQGKLTVVHRDYSIAQESTRCNAKNQAIIRDNGFESLQLSDFNQSIRIWYLVIHMNLVL